MVDDISDKVMAPDKMKDVILQKEIMRDYLNKTYEHRLNPLDIRFRTHLRVLKKSLIYENSEIVLTDDHILCYALLLSVRATQTGIDLEAPHLRNMRRRNDRVNNGTM
jgi:hypothetical protein